MGMYTGLRFKGIIKKEYREDFEKIFTPYEHEDQEVFEWSDSKHEDLFLFGLKGRSSMVKNTGNLAYMPWEEDGDTSYNGFNKSTGELNFQCSIKNYDGEIQAFLNIVPNFTETLQHCEVLYEEWLTGDFYKLKDGELMLAVKAIDNLDEYGR